MLVIKPDKDKELSPLEQQRQAILKQRAELMPMAKKLVVHIIEHIGDNLEDSGLECELYNKMQEGDSEEHISGAHSLQELKQNRRLLNLLANFVVSNLIYVSPREKEMIELWFKRGHKS